MRSFARAESVVKTRTVWVRHPDEDALENYARHKLSELESGALEAHLLACGTCQETLADIDAFILALKENAMAPEPIAWRAMLRSP